MKTSITITLLLIGNFLFGQGFSFPNFPKSAPSINDFIPANWFIKDSAIGDLNSDGIDDLAIVAEFKDTIQEMRPDSILNTGSPRVLLITFKNVQTGKFDLVLQNNTFIIRYGEGGMDPEVYGDISISNKVLAISFAFIRSQASYKFRYQNNDFYLIGGKTSGVSGGQFESWDINLLTRKAEHEWGDISDIKLKRKWLKLSLNIKKKLTDMKTVFNWEVLPDVYL